MIGLTLEEMQKLFNDLVEHGPTEKTITLAQQTKSELDRLRVPPETFAMLVFQFAIALVFENNQRLEQDLRKRGFILD